MSEKDQALIEHPGDILEIILRVAADPKMEIDKMERLLVMHERIVKENRRVEFMGALARIQAKMPQIEKSGQIIVKGVERSRYAKLEDIDKVIRPLLEEEGFSFSFDSSSTDGKLFVLSCNLSHREGHAETKTPVLPIDSMQYRSEVQSVGSTLSYAKRQLIKMHLNIVEAGEDDDGIGGSEPISEGQVKSIEVLIKQTGADKKRFLEYMEAKSIKDITSRNYPKAISALEAKKRG